MIVLDAVATYARSSPSRRAVVDLSAGAVWTYDELSRAIDRVAAWLVDRFGPRSGERVAVLTRNCAEMPILQLACARAGCVFMPLNWRLALPELEALITDAEPALLFHSAEFTPPANAPVVMEAGKILTLGEAGRVPPPEARAPFEALSTLLYTSGTSGRPKGVMLSEANIYWGCTNLIHANAVNPASTFLCDMPLFHTAGLMAAVRSPLFAGGCVLISPGFDPDLTLARLTDPALGVTHYFSVPQMATTLWQHPAFDASRLQKLVSWSIGGAPNPKAQSERFIRAGIRISDGFGMSEAGSCIHVPPFEFDLMLAKAGTCGLPLLTLRMRIIDAEGKDVGPGEHGELLVAGPSVALGYWRQPELTAQAFADGWYRTGDAAMMDADGFVTIVDRKKDMYISGGENVYPAEVEAALAELPSVRTAAVIGVPDERWGEAGRAYVVPAEGHSITAQEVIAHCTARLAKYKVPKTAVITDAVPATASGKVQKHLLKQRAAEELAGAR